MRINGFWRVSPDTILRPTLAGSALGADGQTYELLFLIDTGADRSVLDFDTYIKLGLSSKPSKAFELEGVGGSMPSVVVPVQLLFARTDGGMVTVNAEWTAFTEPTALGMNILGRDILNLFAVVIDRQGDTVCLLHGQHRYVIQES